MDLRRHRIIRLIVSQQLLVFPALFFVSAFGQQMVGQQMEIYDEVIERPIEILSDGYVGSGKCGGCHSRNHETWYASYHRTMTQVASPETVIGDFGSVGLDHGGRTYRLERDKEGFWVEIDSSEPSPERQPSRQRHQIALTTGSHHMQVYWYPVGGRALEIVPFIYLKNEKRWIPRYAGFLKPRPLVPPVETGRWNRVCIDCHTTHGQMRIFFSDSREKYLFDSQAAEFGFPAKRVMGQARTMSKPNSPIAEKPLSIRRAYPTSFPLPCADDAIASALRKVSRNLRTGMLTAAAFAPVTSYPTQTAWLCNPARNIPQAVSRRYFEAIRSFSTATSGPTEWFESAVGNTTAC